MRPPPRRRFTFCSACSMLLFVTACTAWAATTRSAAYVNHRTVSAEVGVAVSRGALWVFRVELNDSANLPPRTRGHWEPRAMAPFDEYLATLGPTTHGRHALGFGFLSGGRSFRHWLLMIPLWFIALASAVFPARWAWVTFRIRRPSPGCCPSCGYDLRATPNRCPECGRVMPAMS